MNAVPIKLLLTGLAIAAFVTFGWQARAAGELVKFPNKLADGGTS